MADWTYNTLNTEVWLIFPVYILTSISQFLKTASLTELENKTYSDYFGVFINTLSRRFIRVHIRYTLGLQLPCVPTNQPCVHTQYAYLSQSLQSNNMSLTVVIHDGNYSESSLLVLVLLELEMAIKPASFGILCSLDKQYIVERLSWCSLKGYTTIT